ncbi:MAG: rane protein [Segetibacter sp.]|nr:rane protein [Segetibacter sp.]
MKIIYQLLKLKIMLRWTITFLIVAIIAAVFGFGNIAAGAAGIAKVLFFIFIVLFLLSLIGGRKTID